MIKRHTFENGFQVVYQKSEQSIPLTCIHVFCNVGSAFEIDGIRGASHLVEHMCFKGTNKRKEARDILKQYDQIGAFFNAYTEKRYTAYIVKCNDKYVQHCSEILGDMLMHSMFPRKEFDKEQKVVVEESIRGMNDDEYMLQERMDQIVYRGSTYEYPIDCLKYHPSPTFLQYDDIFEWYHWFYHPSNMICSVVSNLSFSTILSVLKKTAFYKSKDKHRLISMKKPEFVLEYPILSLSPVSTLNKGESRVEYYPKKGVSTDIINIVFRTCDRSSPDKYPLKVLKHILNGLSGKLFTALRTKHGLTYNSECNVEYYEHTGYLSIQIQTDPKKVIEDNHHIGVLPIVLRLLSDLKTKGVTQEDIRISKGNIQGKFILSMQSMDTITEYNGIESVYLGSSSSCETANKKNTFVSYPDIYETFIAKITKAQIEEIIAKYLTRENMVIGIMYENGINKKKIEEICNRYI
jgi:predicted Zn-dependent peptidase